MKLFAPILLLLLLASCQKEDFTITNLNGNRIAVLGHAGMGTAGTYPMNSAESILSCLYSGADGTELDVQMTVDSVLVLFHDPDLSNSTNLSGTVQSRSWDEISKARYNNTPYLDYNLLSLDQLFSGLEDPTQYIFTLDCKHYSIGDGNQYNAIFERALAKILLKYGLENSACIESQDPLFLNLLKQLHPSWKLFIYPESFETGIDIALEMNLFGITISSKNISKEQIGIAHDHQLRVAIWNIDTSRENKEAIEKNPDYIQTDQVENLVKLLK